jgi:hypothetical protein
MLCWCPSQGGGPDVFPRRGAFSRIPWFVYAILGACFVLFNLFPVNMVLQYHKIGKWADYRYGERGYILLSLVAKSLLACLFSSGPSSPRSASLP